MTKQGLLYRFPALDASDEDIQAFQERHFTSESRYRCRHLERINRSLWYILGKQWAELDLETLAESARGYALKEMEESGDVELPRPVTNHIAPAIDVEFATLSKRQWIPKIPTYSRDPRLEAAAKVAHDVLNDRLRKLYWEDLRDQFILDCISMGTATMHSFWDASFFETTWNAVEAPVYCPNCQKLYASALLPAAYFPFIEAGNVPNAQDLPDDDPVEAKNCLYCGGPFQSINLTSEGSHGWDMFGRPLGGDIPKGQTALELVTPFEYYPENAGVDKTPETIHQHGICKIRSLDWVEEHHPDLIDDVEPEEANELMQLHPLLGEWDILGRYDHSLDAGMYDHHVRVYDLFADPSYRFPQGRALRLIGSRQKLIARNEALIREVAFDGEKLSVQTDLVTSAIWKPRRGELWGKTLADDLLSPQNRINGIDAQVIEARERMGSPNLLVPDDSDMQGPEWRADYGLGKIMRYQASAINQTSKPEVFGGVTMPSGVNLERDRCVQDMTKIIGPADIEIGEAPRNITTTSGLQILGEQAERRRATRERGITSAFKKVWEHQLRLLWTLRVDEDSYEAETPDGKWEMKQYTGQALKGQTKVEIEKQAYIEKSIIVREAAMEATKIPGLYDLSTPLARKKFLDLVGLPSDINEDSNLQIDHARRIWVDFVDSGKVPVIDPAVDDPAIRKHVLGTMFLQGEGERLSEQALWPQLLPLLAGWEEELQSMVLLDQKVRIQYGGEPAPDQAAEQYAQFTRSYQETQVTYERAVQGAQASGLPIDPNMKPPEKPLPPKFLPKQPEHRIYLVWQGMLERKGQPADLQTGTPGVSALDPLILQAATKNLLDPAALKEKVDKYLRFRAVFEAYRIMSPELAVPGATPNPTGPAPNVPPPGMVPPGPPLTPNTPPLSPSPVGA
jgi:hypothetical protein